MLHFRKGPPPRNYLARHEQMRLFVLVMLLMAVVWIAVEARNPEHYHWIWNWGEGDGAVDEAVDTRVQTIASTPDDTFVFPAPGENWEDPIISGPLTAQDLASVRDDEPFRTEERVAWFKLLNELQKTDAATLKKKSIGTVTFIQLYRQPREYRGELMSFSGTMRRSEKIAAPKNEQGIESYFRTWLFPDDNPTNPIVIYTLTVPDGFPEGMNIEERVELEGFFFKRWPYAAVDTIRSAPVVLAKALRWTATMPEKRSAPMSPTSIIVVAAAVAISVAVLVWSQTRHTPNAEPVAELFQSPPSGEGTDERRPPPA